ncbi:G2-specific serine/threonine protein kinase [Orbilia oligospora]|uniref:non-specific serine/threonine protein kinase n=1 Tax=Orbilia oligospora TaxID=2813651 RepID=A0A8H8VN36_ORBOL|nr:G2-specific serine/threonine protein kinase [Orbilia oligospora]
MNPDPKIADKDETPEPSSRPPPWPNTRPAGYGSFSWDLNHHSIEGPPPPIRVKSPYQTKDSNASESQNFDEVSLTKSSPAPISLRKMSLAPLGVLLPRFGYALSGEAVLRNPTPGSESGDTPGAYSLPKSYKKDFKVRRKVGAGAFGVVAAVRVISAEDGGIAHGFRLRPGTELIAKKISANPSRKHTMYSREWKILDALRGHRNILHAICTQRPRPNNPFGHIFMEYCDLGDVRRLQNKYKDQFIAKMRQSGVPGPIAYEIMTSIARGLAWMHYGVWDWPLDSAIDPKWIPIMHNDIKADNGDLGGATKLGTVAFVGNSVTASPERLRGCLRIPSVPQDDIFSLGAMMFQVALDVYPFRYDEVPSIHLVLGGPDETFEPITCPELCRDPDLDHFKAPRCTDDGNVSRCEMQAQIKSLKWTKLKHPPPHAEWWHQLVLHCLEMERQDRPDVIEVLERLYLGRRGRREDNVGNPLILWDPFWLSKKAQENLKAREHEFDDLWKAAVP